MGAQCPGSAVTVPTTAPAATRPPTGTVAATGSTELRSPSSCWTVSTGRSTTTPANVTVPARGARTGVPAAASRSTPRCPAAHGCGGPSNGCSTTTGSTGADHTAAEGRADGLSPVPGPGVSTSTAVASTPASAVSSATDDAAGRQGSGGSGSRGTRPTLPAGAAPGPPAGARSWGPRTPSPPVEESVPRDAAVSRLTSRGPPGGPGRWCLSGRLLPATGACRSTSRVITEAAAAPSPRNRRRVRGPTPAAVRVRPGVGVGVAPGTSPDREASTTGRAGRP